LLNVSDTYKELIKSDSGRCKWYAKADLTLADGTTLSLKNNDFWDSVFSFSDAVTKSGEYAPGAAITETLSATLNNMAGKYDGMKFQGAKMVSYIGMIVKSDWRGDTVEWLKRGEFNVTDYKLSDDRTQITITAADNISKADKQYSSDLTYPATLLQILQDVCNRCGITLATTDFPNSSYQIFRAIDTNSTTYHDVIACVAGMAGCYARCNADGALELKWFDFSATPIETHNISKYAPDTDDITVTGVKIDSKNVDAKSGNDGYVITLKDSDNKLLQAAIYEQVICDEWAVNINSAIKSKDTDVPARLAGIKSQCVELQNYCSRYGGTYNPTDAERKTFVDSAKQYDSDVKSCIAYLKDSATTVATAAFEPKQDLPDGLTKYISSYYETAQTGMAQEEADLTADLGYITKKTDKESGTNAWTCINMLVDVLYNEIARLQSDSCFAGIDAAKIEYKGKLLTSADFSDLPGRLVTVRQHRDVANVQQIVDNIDPHLIGNTLTPYSATIYSNPALEAGDIVDIEGRKSVITNLTYKLNSAETISCEAKSQAENSSDFYSESEKLWDELQALNTKSEELRIKIQKLADGLESTVSRGDEASDIKQLYNTIDLSVSDSEKKTSAEIKMTADSITSSVDDKVGGLQSQITQQAGEIESKVSRTDLSTAIKQSPEDIVYAFNNQSKNQSIKMTGDGFDFFYNDEKICHLGVEFNKEVNRYDVCIQPSSGHGTYFGTQLKDGEYSLMHLGYAKFSEGIASDGMISTPQEVNCGSLKINGQEVVSSGNISTGNVTCSGYSQSQSVNCDNLTATNGATIGNVNIGGSSDGIDTDGYFHGSKIQINGNQSNYIGGESVTIRGRLNLGGGDVDAHGININAGGSNINCQGDGTSSGVITCAKLIVNGHEIT